MMAMAIRRIRINWRPGTRVPDPNSRNSPANQSIGASGGDIEQENYHVFMCYNSVDNQAVWRVYERLSARGIRPWLDEMDVRPGFSWQSELERVIERIEAAAVFVGPSGIGPWQDEEIQAFLNEFVQRQRPVIPVLLPRRTDAPTPDLPFFLRARQRVDLRSLDEAEIDRLEWGITGRKPDHGATPPGGFRAIELQRN